MTPLPELQALRIRKMPKVEANNVDCARDSKAENNNPQNNPPLKRITKPDGETLAYRRSKARPSTRGAGVVYLAGFADDMNGTKALAIEEHCKQQGRAFVSFDYSGTGESSGDFKDGTISKWTADAIFAIEQLTEGPQVLVGSSMGGWVMFLVALELKSRIVGLVGINASPDFTVIQIESQLTDDHRSTLEKDGFIEVPGHKGDGSTATITKALIDDGRESLLLTGDDKIQLEHQNVRLIHGANDFLVPPEIALRLQDKLAGNDVQLTMIKDGDHDLSSPENLEIIMDTLDSITGERACIERLHALVQSESVYRKLSTIVLIEAITDAIVEAMGRSLRARGLEDVFEQWQEK